MKRILTVIFVLISTISFAQCYTPVCQGVVTFPININDYNNSNGIYAGYGPNRCIQGNGTFTNNLNEMGGWQYWSFSGIITIQQTININTGKRLFLSGTINMSNFSMAGGNDSAIIYVASNSSITCNNVQNPNNTHNYVYLGPGAAFTMGGTLYVAGQTYQGPGNNTNVVHFLSCTGSPLANYILNFELKQDVLKWKVESNEQIEIQYSEDSRIYKTIFYSYQKDGGSIIVNPGFYRLKVGNEVSNVIKYNIKESFYQPNEIYFYDNLFQRTKPMGRSFGTKKLK